MNLPHPQSEHTKLKRKTNTSHITRKHFLNITSVPKKLHQNKNHKYRTVDHYKNQEVSSFASINSSKNQPNILINLKQAMQTETFQVSPERKPFHYANVSIKRLSYINSKAPVRYQLTKSIQGLKDAKQKKSKNKSIKNINQPAVQQSPINMYMNIEKIEIPKTSTMIKERSTLNNKSYGFCSETIKKTLFEYDCYLKKMSDMPLTAKLYEKNRMHERNYSAVNSGLKCQKIQYSNRKMKSSYIQLAKKNKKVVEEFCIRKPVLRKDYFVFGMTDRPNQENKVEHFRDFLWKVNFSNGIYVNTPENIPNPYKAYIGPGNNYYLVKGVLKRRFWWTVLENDDLSNPKNLKDLNFLWTQLKQNNFFPFQKKSKTNQNIQNKQIQFDIENDSEIQSSRSSLSPHLKNRMLQRQNSSFEQTIGWQNHEKIFYGSDLFEWKKHCSKNIKNEIKISENTYSRRMPLFYSKEIKYVQNSQKQKIHNHLEFNYFIGNKKALFYNLRKYLTLKNIDPFTYIPHTFHISKGVDDQEFKQFQKYFLEIEEEKNIKGLKNIWIVKPGQNSNRGNGISVAYSIDDVKVRLKGKQRNTDGKLRTFIVQKYIQKPLLYRQRKFDIRHFVLLTCMNGSIKGYWYEEGFIRTSSFEYNIKNCRDPFVHLTNDAIQKNSEYYGRYERGNKLSYSDFQKYLDSLSNLKKKKNCFFEEILPSMKFIAAQSIRSCYSLLDPSRRENNFELLGLDFMLDENLKPYLIQINTNPCLELSCSLLQKIIPQLIDNVFKICIDPIFPPPQIWLAGKKFFFGENTLAQNKFEIIFDETNDGEDLNRLYRGQQKIDKNMGKIEQDDQTYEDDGDENWEGTKKEGKKFDE